MRHASRSHYTLSAEQRRLLSRMLESTDSLPVATPVPDDGRDYPVAAPVDNGESDFIPDDESEGGIPTHPNGILDLGPGEASRHSDKQLLTNLRRYFPKDGDWAVPPDSMKLTSGQAHYFLKALSALLRLASERGALPGGKLPTPYDQLQHRLTVRVGKRDPKAYDSEGEGVGSRRREEPLAGERERQLAGIEEPEDGGGEEDFAPRRRRRRPEPAAYEPPIPEPVDDLPPIPVAKGGEWSPSYGRQVMSPKRMQAAKEFFTGQVRAKLEADPAFKHMARMSGRAKRAWMMDWLKHHLGDQFHWPANKVSTLMGWLGIGPEKDAPKLEPQLAESSWWDGRPEAGTIKEWVTEMGKIPDDVVRVMECWNGPSEKLTPDILVSILREEYEAGGGPVSEPGMRRAVADALVRLHEEAGLQRGPNDQTPDYPTDFPSLFWWIDG